MRGRATARRCCSSTPLGALLASLAFVSTASSTQAGAAQSQHLSDYVNTLRGSDSTARYSHGNTFPAVTLPFGFNFWTPITTNNDNDNGWLYNYESTTLTGFAVSHEPSPWIGDYGSIQVMPGVGSIQLARADRAAAFRHQDETAHAHYYSVLLASGIKTEIAPTLHSAAWRFTYPSGSRANLLFDSVDSASGSIKVDVSARRVSGYVDDRGPRLYFVAQLDQPIKSVVDPDGGGVNVGVLFAANAAPVVTMKMATSFISVEQAKANLQSEISTKSFANVRDEAQATWDALLGRVTVEGASEDRATTLYSCLYRAFMYPNTMSENVAGNEQHFSPYVAAVGNGPMYVNNGFWDTYRAAWPLYILLVPAQAGRMLDGFVMAFKEAGWTPRWSGPGYLDVMVGTHADIVLADAYLKGIRNFDARAAYDSMLKNALVYSSDPATGRHGNEQSIFRGYIPMNHVSESAAWYLEDCVNDFGISRMADAMGDPLLANYFQKRSLAYVNLFSPASGFFRGKSADGSFRTSDSDFRPNEWGYEFTEGSAWQYVAAASHDPRGMANLYGGIQAFDRKLDSVLSAPRDFLRGSYSTVIHEMLEAYDANLGQYAHPNEPVQHLLYMFNYVGQPWKTQKYVREVLSGERQLDGSGIGDGRGYLGDEDNGQMSAWYVWSALGLYPASPGHAEYAIGSPLHDRMELHLENGHTFAVVAVNNSSENLYIQSATLNGAPYNKNFIGHEAVLNGGVLELVMGRAPSDWGSAPDARPTSITQDERVPKPMADCAHGGSVAASDENASAGERGAQAFDDDSSTKWLAFSARGSLQYTLPEPCVVHMYTLTSANDFAERDPQDWTLSGSHDGASWEVLDERQSESFPLRRQTRVFGTNNHQAYEHYQLTVTKNHAAPMTQLAEVEFIGAAPDAASDVASTSVAGSGDSPGGKVTDSGCSSVQGCANGASWLSGVFGALGLLLLMMRRRAGR